jgi:hypothetical protein
VANTWDLEELIALSLILLVYSGLSARHTEISYGE